MINGMHVVIYTTEAEKDRALFRDVLKFPIQTCFATTRMCVT